MTEHLGLAIIADLIVKGTKKLASALSGPRTNQQDGPPARVDELEEGFEYKITIRKTRRESVTLAPRVPPSGSKDLIQP